MILASAAMAQTRMTDAEMTAMIVGVWTSGGTYPPVIYKADGTVVFQLNGKDIVEKWWVKDGALLETDDSIRGGLTYYKILFLTEDEFLTLGMTSHSKGYVFLYRKYLDY